MNKYYFTPKIWKWETLKILVQRAHVISSTDNHMKKEDLKHIRRTYNKINNYPHLLITKVFKDIKEMTTPGMRNEVKEVKNTIIKNLLLVLPYKGNN